MSGGCASTHASACGCGDEALPRPAEPHVASPASPPIELPTLQRATLDASSLRAAAAAIDALASQVEVLVKAAPDRDGEVAGVGVSAERAVELLVAGMLRGVQLRYVHEGVAWIDSLRPDGGDFALVRMQVPSRD